MYILHVKHDDDGMSIGIIIRRWVTRRWSLCYNTVWGCDFEEGASAQRFRMKELVPKFLQKKKKLFLHRLVLTQLIVLDFRIFARSCQRRWRGWVPSYTRTIIYIWTIARVCNVCASVVLNILESRRRRLLNPPLAR